MSYRIQKRAYLQKVPFCQITPHLWLVRQEVSSFGPSTFIKSLIKINKRKNKNISFTTLRLTNWNEVLPTLLVNPFRVNFMSACASVSRAVTWCLQMTSAINWSLVALVLSIKVAPSFWNFRKSTRARGEGTIVHPPISVLAPSILEWLAGWRMRRRT